MRSMLGSCALVRAEVSSQVGRYPKDYLATVL